MASKPWFVTQLNMRRKENEDAKDKGEVIYYSATQKSQDVGSIESKKALSFQFTRHATSCFNIEIDKPSVFSISDGIPSLAKIGISDTISLADKNKDTPRFKSPIVCVSNLVRTWMTAILLYKFNNKDKITLRICPHLKEAGNYGLPGAGNGAFSLTESIPKFMSFLQIIRSYPAYHNLGDIILLIPQYPNNYDSWARTVIRVPEDRSKPIVNDPSFCNIFIKTDPLLEKGYTNVGNIQEFMEWYKQSFPEQEEKVHIVAHNIIMKHYFDEKFKTYKGVPFNIDEYNLNGSATTTKEIKKIPKEVIEGKPMGDIPLAIQNCWSFTTTIIPIQEKVMESIQLGYINSGKNKELLNKAKKLEEDKEVKSLCLEATEPTDCSKVIERERKEALVEEAFKKEALKKKRSQGGKRTKKNHRSCTRRRS